MKIKLTYATAHALNKAGITNHPLDGFAKPPDSPLLQMQLDVTHWSVPNLKSLHTQLKKLPDAAGAQRMVAAYLGAMTNPQNRRVPSIQSFKNMLLALLGKNPCWLFNSGDDDKAIAYLPIEVMIYQDRNNYSSGRNDPYALLTLGYNIKGGFTQRTIRFMPRDLGTVAEMLALQGLVMETPELLESYRRNSDKYSRLMQMDGEQFYVRRTAAPLAESFWWSERNSQNLSKGSRPTKAVLDLAVQVDGEKAQSQSAYRDEQQSLWDEKRHAVPVHHVMPVFSLAHHAHYWVHVRNMKPYEYEDLADRLVLPKSHTNLIGALVSNLDALRVEGESDGKSRLFRAKASSSVILASGPAGTGKTLTAEIYAETIKRPLYEVSAAQLGTDGEEMEGALSQTLELSSRLRMVLVINEADVFIAKRGVSLEQNAVVSVFLRLLEYHNGLLFLTTNRSDDIDDAMVSRCIAHIRYTPPRRSELRALWGVMLKEFGLSLSPEDIDHLCAALPSIVGRDIQNLIRLTHRVCLATGAEFGYDTLIENSVFRGLDPKEVARMR